MLSIWTRAIYLMASLSGVFPMELKSILVGRPKYSLISCGVLLALVNLAVDMFLISLGAIGGGTGSTGEKCSTPPSLDPSCLAASLKARNLTNSQEGPTSTDNMAVALYGASVLGTHMFTLLLGLFNRKRMEEMLELNHEILEDISEYKAKQGIKDKCFWVGLPQLFWTLVVGGLIWGLSSFALYLTLGSDNTFMVVMSGERCAAMVFTGVTFWCFTDSLIRAFSMLKARLTAIANHSYIQDSHETDVDVVKIHDAYCRTVQLCEAIGSTMGSAMAVEAASHLLTTIANCYFVSVFMNMAFKECVVIWIWICYFGLIFLRFGSLGAVNLGSHRVRDEDEDFRGMVRRLYVRDLKAIAKKHPLEEASKDGRMFLTPSIILKQVKDRDDPEGRLHEMTSTARLSLRSRELLADIINRDTLALTANGYFSLTKENLCAAINIVLTYVIILVQFRQEDSKG